jgi:hypothetical protein
MFLIRAAYVVVPGLVILVVYLWVRYQRSFNLRFLVFKNAGGGSGNHAITIPKVLVRKAKIVDTEYGQKLKIKGVSDLFDPISYDNAATSESGYRTFIVYEKEDSQLFPVKPEVIVFDNVEAKRKEKQFLKDLYESLVQKFPEYKHLFKLRTAKEWQPVIFRNDSVKLQPVPADMITQYSYKIISRIKRNSIIKKYEKLLPYVALTFSLIVVIVVAVLSYEQVTKTGAQYLSALKGAEDGIASKVAEKLKDAGSAPPGIIIPFYFLKTFLGGVKRGGYRNKVQKQKW